MVEYDVLVVGAGIVGPPLAVGLARHGRRVMVLERDLNEPDRIVGELLQPGGIEALKQLGLEHTPDGIDSVAMEGYQVIHNGQQVHIPYPEFAADLDRAPETTLGTPARGRGFHHGRFVQNLRKAAAATPGVTLRQATVTDLIRNDYTGHVLGAMAKTPESPEKPVPFFAKLVIVCDGTGSKFRKEYSASKPQIQSYFVGTMLKNPQLVKPRHGHVIIGTDHQPILVYETSSTEARILCDVPAPLPSIATGELKRYLETRCLPYLPKELQPSFREALDTTRLRSMPNQYLPARRRPTPGLILLGDAINMRHPLTGGGMTVGIKDALMVSNLLGPRSVDLTDYAGVEARMREFSQARKSSVAVVNVLSVALYALFSGATTELKILQRGCFHYFQFGGACVRDPAALLSGLLARPAVLFYHFFAVAFLAVWDNFVAHGILGFPVALLQMFTTLFRAVVIFVPFLVNELLRG